MEHVANAIERYRDFISLAGDLIEEQRLPGDTFSPPFTLPAPSRAWTRYFDASALTLCSLELSGGHRVLLLDLMRHAPTRTVKTLSSLTMVARAVAHTQATGERVALVTASSGNKATALRDAVWRAYEHGIASPDTLRVLSILPVSSRGKLRCSPLTATPQLRACNPVFLYDVAVPEQVKDEALHLIADLSGHIGWRLWNSADLDNYRLADSVRALVEAEFFPITEQSPPRWHVHAVSSGYGFLGYELGHQVLLGRTRLPVPAAHPAFLIVQQPATPALVGGVLLARSGTSPPSYLPWRDRFVQTLDPHFPAELQHLHEVVDPTFYSSRPATADTLVGLTIRHGGDGIVVSQAECAAFYAKRHDLFATALDDAPADGRDLREWSLVMALTGLSQALARGIIAPGSDIVVHGTGCYTDRSLPPISSCDQIQPHDCRELHDLARLSLASPGR